LSDKFKKIVNFGSMLDAENTKKQVETHIRARIIFSMIFGSTFLRFSAFWGPFWEALGPPKNDQKWKNHVKNVL